MISACEGKSIKEIEQELQGQGYGSLKNRAAEAIINTIRPIREKYEYYLNNQDELFEIMSKGAKKAEIIAKETLQRAKLNMGLF